MLPINILLVDDHALIRVGLSMVLQSAIAGVQVLEASSLEEAMRGQEKGLDLVLLDIELQGLNGLDGIALLKRKWPQTPIVMLSSDATRETMQLALERGAAGFLSKAETGDKMLAIIRQVLHDEPTTPMPGGGAGEDTPTQALLTPRQCEVLDLLCRGLSNKLIGRRLGLSENTVRGHVQAVLAALQVTSRSEAAYEARKLGLVR